jgi:sulfonate transport system permease protein
MLFVTHDVDEAMMLGTRVIVVRNGSIAEDRAIDLPMPRSDDDLAIPEGLRLSICCCITWGWNEHVKTNFRASRLLGGVTILLALVLAWELLSLVVTTKGSYDEPLIPGWGYLIGNSLLRMSDYWGGGLGVPAPSEGGPPTYAAALLALCEASLVTFERVIGGIVFGVLGGVGLGLLVATSDVARRLIAPTVHIVRMTPFLAMIPLFNLWFGANTFGIILFVAYGVAVIMFIGTVNAVRNVPKVYFDRAATVGASRAAVFRHVVLPAIFPEIRASFLLSFGLSWSLVVGGELLGAQSGLGVIVTYASKRTTLLNFLTLRLSEGLPR